MKNLLCSFLLLIALESSAQDSTYQVLGWHQANGVTFMQVKFSFNSWAVFQLEGNHLGNVPEMIQGCILTKKWGLYLFSPIPDLSYVTTKDEQQIKQALGLQTLCNR